MNEVLPFSIIRSKGGERLWNKAKYLVSSVCKCLPGILDSQVSASVGQIAVGLWKIQWTGNLTTVRAGYRWVVHPAQRGLALQLLVPFVASLLSQNANWSAFWPDKHLRQQTTVTPLVRPFSLPLLCNYTPQLARGGEARLRPCHWHQHHCRHVLEKQREWGRYRESEWAGRWGKDSFMWDSIAGGEAEDPPPSCERLEAVCVSTSG